MKWLLLAALLVLALSVNARADINFIGGGGGGGAGITVDPSLNTNGGKTGIAFTPEQYGAKADIKVFSAGAMDNNVTANLTDTTNHPFAAGDVNKLVCVNSANAATITDHTNTRHQESCGTITAFVSSSVVTLSFNNASGAAISGVQYAYATDDTTAVQNAENAACNAGGGMVYLTKTYTMSATLTMCTTAGVSLIGSSGGLNAPFIGQGPGFWWAKSASSASPLSGHGILYSGTTGNTVRIGSDSIQNIALQAGLGGNYSGGSTTSAGIATLNWNILSIQRVAITGFGLAGYYGDVIGASINDDLVNINLEQDFIAANGNGVQIGSAATAGFGGFFQEIHIGNTSTISANLNFGFEALHDIHDLTIDGANIFQANDEAASTSFADFSMGKNCYGCSIKGNYFEDDFTNERSIVLFPASGNIICPNIENNFFLDNAGSSQFGLVLGNNSSNNAFVCTVANNWFQGFVTGQDIDILGFEFGVLLNNGSTATSFDEIDQYGSTSNTPFFKASQSGLVTVPELATTSAAPSLTAGCNGAGVVAPTGTNFQGFFTTQTAAATTCTLTKSGGACANRYICEFWDASASITPVAFSTGALGTSTAVVDFASATAKKIGYTCSCQ